MSQQQRKRRRGVVLTPEGLRRLQGAIQGAEIEENGGERYTLENLSFRIGLDPKTIARILDRERGIDRRSLQRCFGCFDLELSERDYSKASEGDRKPPTQPPIDWGEAIDISHFAGRHRELATLSRWVQEENCRAIAILGMGGMGKTALSVKLTLEVCDRFELLIWRSLRHAPPLTELLRDLLQFFSPEDSINLLTTSAHRLRQLLGKLKSHRCLIVLDNWETLLRSSADARQDIAGQYREEYQDYGLFLRQVSETAHESVIILTSREKPAEIAALEGEILPVRTFLLEGLPEPIAAEIFKGKGLFGSETQYRHLSQLYQGNPLALKIVATAIQDIFSGEIGDFLAQKTLIFNGVRILLDEQFQRLSSLEREVMYWLAINREPVTLRQLQSDFATPVSTPKLLEALESLKRRSLLENVTRPSAFTLQPVVMEYVTTRAIDRMSQEIIENRLNLFHTHALIKAQSKNYLRAGQIQLILQPILEQLIATYRTPKAAIAQLHRLLTSLRQQHPPQPGYASGNLLNLLIHLNADLTGWDFSNLTVWQAYLADTPLPQVNFSGSDLAKSVFAKTFSVMMAVAFSPDGRVLASANWDYNVYLWEVETGSQLAIYSGHQDKVWSVVFHPRGHLLATGSDDGTIKLWDTRTGQCLRTIATDGYCLRSLVFSPSGEVLASSGGESTVRLWDIQTGDCLREFEGHTAQVWAVDIALGEGIEGKRELLASASDDLTVKVWEIETGRCLRTLKGHRDWLRSVKFSPDGRWLASSSVDRTIRLWDLATGECLRVLEGHTNLVYSLVFAREGKLVSGGFDATIRLWNLATGQCTRVLSGHTNSVYGLAVDPTSTILASSSADQTLRLWSLNQGVCIRTIQGRINWISSVAFSPDGTRWVSGSEDRRVRIWQRGKERAIATLGGHRNLIYTVAFSPDNRTLASGSADTTVRLWDADSGQLCHLPAGHTAPVMSVKFSPDGRFLASGSSDGTAKLWEVATGEICKTFPGHFVQTVAFSPDGTKLAIAAFDSVVSLWDIETQQCCQTFVGHTDWAWSTDISSNGRTLATGSVDGSIRLWDTHTGECLHCLQGHTGWIFSVAFSPRGTQNILASTSSDCTIKLWDVPSGTCLQTLQDHTNWVMSAAFSPEGDFLISGSGDTTLKLWDVSRGVCVQTCQGEQLYEGMKIFGATGLTEAQKATLVALGAVEL